MCFLNDISSGPGNSKKCDFFDWLIKLHWVMRSKIIRLHCKLHIGFYFPIDYIQPYNIPLWRAFLRIVFSTRPLRQQNPFLNIQEEMSLATEISAIIVIQFRCFIKRLKMQASLKMLQEYQYLKGSILFWESSVLILYTSSSTLRLNLLFKTNQMKLGYTIQFNNTIIFHVTQ